jgi:hypothetical protein
VCTTEAQSDIVRSFSAEGLHAKDIHEELFPVYGEKFLPRKV